MPGPQPSYPPKQKLQSSEQLPPNLRIQVSVATQSLIPAGYRKDVNQVISEDSFCQVLAIQLPQELLQETEESVMTH